MSAHIPDAPESVKYHGGYDPADPPHEEPDEIFSEQCCKCGEACNPSESVHNETTDEWTCPNCIEQKQPKPLSPFGTSMEDVLKIVEQGAGN